MTFFKRRKVKNEESKVLSTIRTEEVKVATAVVTSNYDDGSGLGPRCVEWYFLVHEVDGKYHEIFSGKQIEREEDTHCGEFSIKNFNTPYIQKLEPLTEYLKNPEKKVIELELLFDFILDMNVQKQLAPFDKNKEEK